MDGETCPAIIYGDGAIGGQGSMLGSRSEGYGGRSSVQKTVKVILLAK